MFTWRNPYLSEISQIQYLFEQAADITRNNLICIRVGMQPSSNPELGSQVEELLAAAQLGHLVSLSVDTNTPTSWISAVLNEVLENTRINTMLDLSDPKDDSAIMAAYQITSTALRWLAQTGKTSFGHLDSTQGISSSYSLAVPESHWQYNLDPGSFNNRLELLRIRSLSCLCQPEQVRPSIALSLGHFYQAASQL